MTFKETYNPCDECNYSYSKNNQDVGMCKICEFNKLLQEPERKWIPVSERLPKNYEEVLVQWEMINRIQNTVIVYTSVGLIDEHGEWVNSDVMRLFNGRIIAWQPLPEPYKVGEHE